MRDSFDLLNKIFDLSIIDNELMLLLGSPSTLDEQNNRLRREIQTADVIEETDIPFVSFYFDGSTKSKVNYMANKGDLYFDIYAGSIYVISQIAKAIRKLLSGNMEIAFMYEGQQPSGVNGVYKYRLIYNPIIDGV